MIRRLLIRPGAIGDFIVSLPAMESLRGDYTEVWCAGQNVPLARFADAAYSIAGVGLDRLGLLPAEDVEARLRSFDSIVSWYGTGNSDFRGVVAEMGLAIRFLDALPDGVSHAVEFYNRQVGGGASRYPVIECPAVAREFAVVHPFASGAAKRAPLAFFERAAARLGRDMPVHWLCGREEELENAVRIDDLFELACWLRRARVFVGNDSGISHLAAAVGTPVAAVFRNGLARVWAPRGSSVCTVLSS